MRPQSKTSIIFIAALSATALVGCSTPVAEGGNGLISVVASTNVYGSIAEQIGGEFVDVTSIISDPSQDPHSFEADARVQLELSKADVVVKNGGGYDPFVDQLLGSLDAPEQVVLNVFDISPLNPDAENEAGNEHADDEAGDEHAAETESDHDHGAFNEHLWYDFATVAELADELEHEFTRLDPENGAAYKSNAEAFRDGLTSLNEQASALRSVHAGMGVAITEPVPLYLLEAVGLNNVTPDDFSEAIEEGSEVSAAVLHETLELIASGEASVLVYNEQTVGPETEQLMAAAQDAGTPVVSVTELLPADSDYVGWMSGILDSLDLALQGA